MRSKLPIGIASASIAFVTGYTFFVRPWTRFWGATEAEVSCILPGDDIVRHPPYLTTRAITIQASATAIWQWLIQMGQSRGGLYSYDWLENVIGCDIHSTDHILPAYQRLAAGDTIRLTSPRRSDLALEVRFIEPERALVLGSPGYPEESMAAGYPHLSWAFVLDPIDERQTRLIIRYRSDYKSTLVGTLFYQILLEPAHFLMERKMLLGIKQRAERNPMPVAVDTTHNIPIVLV